MHEGAEEALLRGALGVSLVFVGVTLIVSAPVAMVVAALNRPSRRNQAGSA
jgi:hypothetical protein